MADIWTCHSRKYYINDGFILFRCPGNQCQQHARYQHPETKAATLNSAVKMKSAYIQILCISQKFNVEKYCKALCLH